MPEDHPIHDAAEADEMARVRAFLDQLRSVVDDINRAGGHPLHRAVIGGSADVVTAAGNDHGGQGFAYTANACTA